MSPMRVCRSEIPSRSSTSFTKEVFNPAAASAAASADSTETAALRISLRLVGHLRGSWRVPRNGRTISVVSRPVRTTSRSVRICSPIARIAACCKSSSRSIIDACAFSSRQGGAPEAGHSDRDERPGEIADLLVSHLRPLDPLIESAERRDDLLRCRADLGGGIALRQGCESQEVGTKEVPVQAEIRQQTQTLPEQPVGFDETLRPFGRIRQPFPGHNQHVRIGVDGGVARLLQEGVRCIDVRDTGVGELPESPDSGRGRAGGEKYGGKHECRGEYGTTGGRAGRRVLAGGAYAHAIRMPGPIETLPPRRGG